MDQSSFGCPQTQQARIGIKIPFRSGEIPFRSGETEANTKSFGVR